MSYSLRASAPHFADLSDRLRARGEDVVLIAGDRSFSAGTLLAAIGRWTFELGSAGVGSGDICAFEGDYQLETVSLMLALMGMGAIVVPFSYGTLTERAGLSDVAGVEWQIDPVSRFISKRVSSQKTAH